MNRKEQKQIILRLPADTKKQLQLKALQNNISVQELLEKFVNEYLKEEN